jgi:hypothetical protein
MFLKMEESLLDNAEQEICKILQVDEPIIGDELKVDDQEIKVEQEKSIEIKPKSPKSNGVKTRSDLIEKIKESSDVVGNQVEIKKMRLHRRRRNSLERILREQVDRAVEMQAEENVGIPQEHDARLSYAVNTLYSFDLLLCKGIEKACQFTNMIPVEIDSLAETIDSDPRIKNEIKQGFEDWIKESPGMQGWVDQCASPSTRILLCHLYPLMSCLKMKDMTKKRSIPTEIKMRAGFAKVRSVVDPPVNKSHTVPTKKL